MDIDSKLKGLPAIDGDDGHFVAVETDQVLVAIDVDFAVIEVDALAGGRDHLFGIVAEAATGAGIECHLRFHLPVNILPLGICLLYTSDAADDLLCVDL